MTEFESLLERKVDRKGFVAAGALAVMAAGGRLVPEALAGQDVLSGTLFYYNWADYVNPKTYTRFEQKTGVKVRKDFYVSNEALQAKLKAGARGYDLVVPTGYMVAILAQDKLLQRIDWSKLPTARRNISAQFMNQPYDPRNRWSVAKDWGTTGFVYRTDKIRERPTTWRQFFDLMKKNPKRFTLLDGAPEVIGSVAIMMGFGYNTDDRRELDQVRRFLLDLKPSVHSIDSVNYKQKAVAGRSWGGMAWNGDGQFVASKKPARYVVPREGAELWIDCYCIPVGARNMDAAHAWIDFVYDPVINALETSYTFYGSPVKRNLLRGKLAANILNNPAVFPPQRVLANLEPNKVSARGTQLRNRIWTEFKAA